MRSAVCPIAFSLSLGLCLFCAPGTAAATVPAGSDSSAANSAQGTGDPLIPGPLRSFLRMAGISQKVSPEEVLPLLARNAEIHGYQGAQNKTGSPTEFLVLLRRYVQQARELLALAGPQGVIRVSTCDEAPQLLAILGYRFRGTCGKDSSLETADPERAFLTIDSGFPLPELDEKLRTGKPFTYPFSATPVPVLYTENDWTSIDKSEHETRGNDVLDSLLHNRNLARLYWAMARLDVETRDSLRNSPGLSKLLPFAPILDFYGSQICIRSGQVLVPGGAGAEEAWKDVVGASPGSPGEFVEHMLSKDVGWPAAYLDSLSRASQERQAYYAEPHRLRTFYRALRGHDTDPGPARPVFRPYPDLLLLATRLQFDAPDQPSVPGGLDVWKEILHRKGESKLAASWAGKAKNWNSPDQLVEAMFGLSRATDQNGPLEIYLMLSEMDRSRSAEHRLSAATVHLLADKFSRFSNQYPIFCEFHDLSNDSIARFLGAAEALDHIPGLQLRANALGIFQANVGLWQILARQGEIPAGDRNGSWQRVIRPFAEVSSEVQLFDAGRASLSELYRAAIRQPNISQDQLIELLAGPRQSSPDGQRMRQYLADRIHLVMNGQRLASLDTLFALADGLSEMANGKQLADAMLPLAGELHEFELPRPMFTSGERSEWAAGVPVNRHSGLQARTDLTKIVKSPRSPKELADARGLLAPFLRDTLVGLNYAYYEPPGAQMLHNNPLFVRSHDFSGQMTLGGGQSWQTSSLFGSGLPAAGGAHLAGSLADLPFVLARVEEDFIVPENVQALIWQEVVPSLVTSAVLPRWWDVSRNELHAVALYQRAGEELVSGAAGDANLRKMVMDILEQRMLPKRAEFVAKSLVAGQTQVAVSEVTPGETFYLTSEFRRRFPDQQQYWGDAGKELGTFAQAHPAETNPDRLAEDFGVPHPALAHTYARELFAVKPFPALMDYASRLLAESWDSNNLYWARLADEMGYSPVMLNQLAPELTHRMVEKIFASDFEDWQAMMRALRETGLEFREGKFAALAQR